MRNVSRNYYSLVILFCFSLMFNCGFFGDCGDDTVGMRGIVQPQSEKLLIIEGPLPDMSSGPAAGANAPSRAAEFGASYVIVAIDRDAPSQSMEIAPVKISGNNFSVSIALSGSRRTPMIVVRDKNTNRPLLSAITGKVPRYEEVPEAVRRIIVRGVLVNPRSTSLALLSLSKNINPDIPIVTIKNEEETSETVVREIVTSDKTLFDAVVENRVGGTTIVSEFSKAVQTVTAVLTSPLVSSELKAGLNAKLGDTPTAVSMLSTFVNVIGSTDASVVSTVNNASLTRSVKISETVIDSRSTESVVNEVIKETIDRPADSLPPSVEYLSISPSVVRPGETIVLSLRANKPLIETPVVKILGRPAAVSRVSEVSFIATIIVRAEDPAIITFSVDNIFDNFGNRGVISSKTTDGSIALVDKTYFPSPSFSIPAGIYDSTISVAITSSAAPDGAAIVYTLDGTAPAPGNGKIYDSPVAIPESAVLKAAVIKENKIVSGVSSASYVIEKAVQKTAAPVIDPVGSTYYSAIKISMASSTPNSVITYTTDGTTPSATNGAVYSAPFELRESAKVMATAYSPGMKISDVSVAVYVIESPSGKCEMPETTLAAGAYDATQSVALACKTEGASIVYTLDGSAPSAANGIVYTGPFELAATCVLKAVAIKKGMLDSDILTTEYKFSLPLPEVAIPSFTPASTIFSDTLKIEISCPTPDAKIYYTLDGTAPSAGKGTLYSGAFILDRTAVVSAIAVKAGMKDSAVASVRYTNSAAVNVPEFSLAAGQYTGTQSVAISSGTENAIIYYTLNGTVPSPSNGLIYSGTIEISASVKIKAIAVKEGLKDSVVAEAEYIIFIPEPPAVATPEFTPAAGEYDSTVQVSITCATQGATIYYTLDGGAPSAAANLYTGPVEIFKTSVIKAIAVKAGMKDSRIAETAYTVLMPVAVPVFKPAGGTLYSSTQEIAITCATPGAVIYYTLDSSEPTRAGLKYEKPFVISRTTTLKAFAVKEGMKDSAIRTAEYPIKFPASEPSLSVAGGTYSTIFEVKLTSATPGAKIYYTLDGSDPTPSNGLLYTSAVEISKPLTIKAITVKEDMTDSTIVSATYVVPTAKAATPVFSPDGGFFYFQTAVKISCESESAEIYFTTDGSDPTKLSNKYEAAFTLNRIGTTTVKALAVRDGMFTSEIAVSKPFQIVYAALEPTFASAATSADGTKILVTFNKNMKADGLAAGDFAVVIAPATPVAVTGIALNADPKIVELTLATPVAYGQTATVAYTKGTAAAADGTALSSFAAKNVTNAVTPSGDAALKASSTIKGKTITSLGTPGATIAAAAAGSVIITPFKAADTSNAGAFVTLFEKNASTATVAKVVKYAKGAPTTNFETSDAAYNNEAISDEDFFIVRVNAQDPAKINYYRIVVRVLAAVPDGTYTIVSAAPTNDTTQIHSDGATIKIGAAGGVPTSHTEANTANAEKLLALIGVNGSFLDGKLGTGDKLTLVNGEVTKVEVVAVDITAGRNLALGTAVDPAAQLVLRGDSNSTHGLTVTGTSSGSITLYGGIFDISAPGLTGGITFETSAQAAEFNSAMTIGAGRTATVKSGATLKIAGNFTISGGTLAGTDATSKITLVQGITYTQNNATVRFCDVAADFSSTSPFVVTAASVGAGVNNELRAGDYYWNGAGSKFVRPELLIAAKPVVSLDGTAKIVLTTATAGAEIRYTLDGSAPSAASTLYTVPLAVSGANAALKAVAIKAGYVDSPVATAPIVTDTATLNTALNGQETYIIPIAGLYNGVTTTANTLLDGLSGDGNLNAKTAGCADINAVRIALGSSKIATINIPAGNFSSTILTVSRAVSIVGAGDTTIFKGMSLNANSISVKNLKLTGMSGDYFNNFNTSLMSNGFNGIVLDGVKCVPASITSDYIGIFLKGADCVFKNGAVQTPVNSYKCFQMYCDGTNMLLASNAFSGAVKVKNGITLNAASASNTFGAATSYAWYIDSGGYNQAFVQGLFDIGVYTAMHPALKAVYLDSANEYGKYPNTAPGTDFRYAALADLNTTAKYIGISFLARTGATDVKAQYTTDGINWTDDTVALNAASTQATLNNVFNANTTYYVRLAITGGSYAGYSEAVKITTKPLAAPVFVSAKTSVAGDRVLVTFDKPMSDAIPASPAGFTLTCTTATQPAGTPVAITAVTRNASNTAIYELTLAENVGISGKHTLRLSYTAGTLKSYDDVNMNSFANNGVTLTPPAFKLKFGQPTASQGDQFKYPQALTACNYGGTIYLFVLDNANYRIKKYSVDQATGALTYLGWFGRANDLSVGFHAPGSLYGVSSSSVNGSFGFSYSYPICTMGLDSNYRLYVADNAGANVQKFDLDGNFLMKFSVTLLGNKGLGCTVDGNGNTYYSVGYNGYFVNKHDAAGNFAAWLGTGANAGWHDTPPPANGVAGDGENDLRNPAGSVCDSANNYYLADGYRIKKFDQSSNLLGWWGRDTLGNIGWHASGSGHTAASSNLVGGFNFVLGLSLDSDGNLYAADRGNNRIQKYDGTSWSVIITGLSQPTGIAALKSGTRAFLFVSESDSHRVKVFASDNGGAFNLLQTVISNAAVYNGMFNNPQTVARDAAGNIYCADNGNYRIQKFDANGNFVEWWGKDSVHNPGGNTWQHFPGDNANSPVQDAAGATPGWFKTLRDLAVDSSGRIYVAEVDKIQVNNGGVWSVLNNGFTSIIKITVDANDDIYVLHKGDATTKGLIYKYSGGGWSLVTDLSGSGISNENLPTGIDISSDGVIYVSATTYTGVKKYVLATSTWSHFCGGTYPNDVAVDSYNNVNVIDMSIASRYNSAGVKLYDYTTSGNGDGQGLNLSGINVYKTGNLNETIISDSSANRVQVMQYQ